MNILVIGNGFDLAHGLPTSYKEFLKFLIQIDVYGLIKDEMNVKRISGENGRSGLLPTSLF